MILRAGSQNSNFSPNPRFLADFRSRLEVYFTQVCLLTSTQKSAEKSSNLCKKGVFKPALA
jgi:hypothetical protein